MRPPHRPPRAPRRVGRATATTERPRRETGVVLVEALVAVFIAGVALLLLVALLVHESRLRLRAAAQHRALATLEGVVEAVRAGQLPAATAVWVESEPPWVILPRGGGRLTLEVTPSDVDEVWNVKAKLQYSAGPLPQERTLATRVWRPG